MAKQTRKSTIRKQKKHVPNGIIHIQSTFNNTIVTITDVKGEVICWASAGSSGFKGARKGTPFAAQTAVENSVRQAIDHGMTQVSVLIYGPGPGRETAIRALQTSGLNISLIKDVTSIPHNGCRPRKKRRI
uniref:Small ribosomal subunit protein uS11c n=1 Tax=Glaucocystis incrassata TaxID=1789788 RepID=A0A3G1IVM9_9EUKA|nr:ribosomal protein S11 [Glaucocystis incrassata]ASQ40116.1 ribosomal protein S11 [Glaucocystis incrassata]